MTKFFDPQVHFEKMRLIEVGRKWRREQGLPEERDVTILYQEGARAEGVPIVETTSRMIHRLPAPHEMTNRDGKFIIPRRDCPQCGRKDGLSLKSLCGNCTDSEGGKYHTMFSCDEIIDKQKVGCGFKTDKSEKFMSQRLSELNPGWEGGMKESLGIKTITDDGLK